MPGAHVTDRMPPEHDLPALRAGDPVQVAAAIAGGADLHYGSSDHWGALLDAVHGRDIQRDPRLLAAGANPARLRWTPLIQAVALGSVEDVALLLGAGFDLEQTDGWARTPWLVALLGGDVQKARLLYAAGADLTACGHCGQPPLSFAVASANPAMLHYTIGLYPDLDARDSFGNTALMAAAEQSDLVAVELLLEADAEVDARQVRVESDDAELEPAELPTALSGAVAPTVVLRLLAAGADPRQLSREARRALSGFDPEPQPQLLQVSSSLFEAGRRRRFGGKNGERMNDPFWLAMVRSGVDAYTAATRYRHAVRWSAPEPVWCARRHGQSLTLLPDGRILQIGGEHEDGYDPDFCIYNDVFVHHPDGQIDIHGYPADVFPPTDFHTATLVGQTVWIIGALGYAEQRKPEQTPVFALDIRSLQIHQLRPAGVAPGWIYKHRAMLIAPQQIRIEGGWQLTCVDGVEQHLPYRSVVLLDLQRGAWLEG